MLTIFAEDAEHTALDRDMRGLNVNRLHFDIRRLQPHYLSFGIETLQRSLRSMHKRDNNFALTCGARSFDEDIITIDDVFIAHGVATNFKSKDIAVANHIVQ